MELIATNTHISHNVQDFMGWLKEMNLVRYASEAADEMEFDGTDELNESIKRAMELCLHNGIPIDGNFRRVYMCSSDGIVYDWKLSVLAYRLVCMNGWPYNPKVAQLQISLLKNIE